MEGIIYIYSTTNNTIFTLTDKKGNTLAWQSPGCLGFKNSKKSTPYAAHQCAETFLEKIKEKGCKKVDLILKGIGSGRFSALGLFIKNKLGIKINKIIERTPIAYNGCRPCKKRRI